MKLFLTYLLLIAPTVKTVSGISGVSLTILYVIAFLDQSEYVNPLPAWIGILGAVLLGVCVLCPGKEAAAQLLEALK